MRTVAAELGMGAMSRYRYVSGRQEMERLAVTLIFEAVDADVDQLAGWQRQVTELGWRFRTAHPAVIPLLLAHYPSSPGAWQWSEAIFAALTEAGFDGPQRVIGLRRLIAYIIGALLDEFFTSLTGTADTVLETLSPGPRLRVPAPRGV